MPEELAGDTAALGNSLETVSRLEELRYEEQQNNLLTSSINARNFLHLHVARMVIERVLYKETQFFSQILAAISKQQTDLMKALCLF